MVLITKQSSGGGSSGYVRKGYSSRFDEDVDVTTSSEALDQIFEFTSQTPTASISASPSFGLREFGNTVTDPLITGSAVTGQNPVGTLTLLEFLRGATDIGTEPTPIPLTNYDKQDVFIVGSNQTYSVKVTDDQTRTDTANGSYSFVYPFYVGVASDGDIFDGIDRTTLLGLPGVDVIVKTKSDTTVTTSPLVQRYVFMYPSSYGNLTSIIDNSGFETLPDYDVFDYDVVGLDGTTQTYKLYQLKGDTTQTDFINNYKF